MPFGCRGHEFPTKGVQGCGLDTANAAPGTTFALQFVVFDQHFPPQAANVTRTIHVVSPCQAGEAFCPDMGPQCSTSSCIVRSAVDALAAVEDDDSTADTAPSVYKHLRFSDDLLPMFTSAAEGGPLASLWVPPHWPAPAPLDFCAGAALGCGVLWGDSATHEDADVRLLSRLQVPDRESVHACSKSRLLAGECAVGQHKLLYQAFQGTANASDVAQVDVNIGTAATSFTLNVSATLQLSGTMGPATREAVVAALSGSTHATNAALHAASAHLAELSQAWLNDAAGGRLDEALAAALDAAMAPNVSVATNASTGEYDLAVRTHSIPVLHLLQKL